MIYIYLTRVQPSQPDETELECSSLCAGCGEKKKGEEKLHSSASTAAPRQKILAIGESSEICNVTGIFFAACCGMPRC